MCHPAHRAAFIISHDIPTPTQHTWQHLCTIILNAILLLYTSKPRPKTGSCRKGTCMSSIHSQYWNTVKYCHYNTTSLNTSTIVSYILDHLVHISFGLKFGCHSPLSIDFVGNGHYQLQLYSSHQWIHKHLHKSSCRWQWFWILPNLSQIMNKVLYMVEKKISFLINV